jgi:hypothetical protein
MSANVQVFRAEITYELHDSSLRDGITCIDYERENKTTYGNCIISALHAMYLEVMGCFPPWIPGSQNRYESAKPVNRDAQMHAHSLDLKLKLLPAFQNKSFTKNL